MKKINPIVWIITAVIVIVILLAIMNTGKQVTEDGFLKVRMYDKNGNLISGSPTFSVVNGISGVSFIDLTVTVLNTGTIPLSCSIISALPTAFDSAIAKTVKSVLTSGEKKASWTSNLISVSQFEGGATPDIFSATVRCSYNVGTEVAYLPDQTGSININIQPDGTGSFTVNLETGGAGTEYCGDGICQTNENSTSCPGDCTTLPNVKFRTTDVSYVSGSAIAFTDICGSSLIPYGAGSLSSGSTSLTTFLNEGILIETLPCSKISCKLGKRSGKTYVGWSTTIGGFEAREYSTSDSDASKVSTNPISFDISKEVIC